MTRKLDKYTLGVALKAMFIFCTVQATMGKKVGTKVIIFGDSQTDTGEDSFSLGFQDRVEFAAAANTGCECPEFFTGCTCNGNSCANVRLRRLGDKKSKGCEVEFDFTSDDDFPFQNGYHRGSATNYPGTWAKQLSSFVNAKEFCFASQAAEALVDKGFNLNINSLRLEYGLDPEQYPYYVPGPKTQVKNFIESKVKIEEDEAVAIMYAFGGNDINVLANSINFSEPLDPVALGIKFEAFAQEVAGNITEACDMLRNEYPKLPIVIGGLTALELTPRFKWFLAYIEVILGSFAAGFIKNSLIAVIEGNPSLYLTGINRILSDYADQFNQVHYFDAYSATKDIVNEASEKDFPYTLILESLSPFVPRPCDPYLDELCITAATFGRSADPNVYAWYDEIHPSAAAQGKMSQKIVNFIDELQIPGLKWEPYVV